MNSKQIVAGLIALAGVGAAGYSIASLQKGEKPGARLMALSMDRRGGPGGGDAPEMAALKDAGAKTSKVAIPMGDAPEGGDSAAASDEPDPGAETPSFPSVATPEAIAELGTNLEMRVGSQASATPEVTAIGAAATAQLGKSLRTLVEPAIEGSRNKVIEALMALGGLSPEEQAERAPAPGQGGPAPAVDSPRGGGGGELVQGPPPGQGMRRSPIPGGPLALILKGASIDWSRARVLPVFINGEDREQERMGMGREVGGAVGASGSVIPGTTAAPGAAGSPPPDAPRRMERRNVMKMISRGAFPEAEDYRTNKMNVVEVRAPLLLEGEEAPSRADALEIGIEMAWNSAEGQWQPVGTKFYTNDPKAQAALQARLRAGMAPPPGGG